MDKYPVGLCQAPVDLGAVLCHPFFLLRTPTAAGRRTRTGLFLCNFYCLFIESLLTSSFICWFSILPVKDGNSVIMLTPPKSLGSDLCSLWENQVIKKAKDVVIHFYFLTSLLSIAALTRNSVGDKWLCE